MGGGTSGDSETTIRYAGYVETHHQAFLNKISNETGGAYHSSPYGDFANFEISDGFFGVGYALSNFPSLYDMYGKFIAGLDIDALATQVETNSIEGNYTSELVSAEASMLEDHINEKILPKFQTGMRDINSVMSSSYIIGKSLIASSQLKAVSKYSAEVKYRLLPLAHEKWKMHLEWNRQVVQQYAELLKLYVSAEMDVEGYNVGLRVKDKLWPFTVLEYQRAALGAIQGAQNITGSGEGPSQTQKAIGGALSGASAGFMLGGPSGAVVGGVLGLAASFL